MKLRWQAWAAIALSVVLASIGGGAAWLLNTNSGARWAFARAGGVLQDALRVERIDGTLGGPLTLTHFRYRDPKSGIDAAAARVHIDIALRELLGMKVHVTVAELSGIQVVMSEPTEPRQEEEKPFTLKAPVDLIVDRFELRDAQIVNKEQPPLAIDSAAFEGQWVGTAVAVRRLDLKSPQGEIHFQADVRQARYYEGEGRGNFRWRAGEREFAGTLQANGRDAATRLLVTLTAPVRARLSAELQQLDTLPWKFEFDAPAFDPRERLMPESSLQSLAARLSGAGTLREGTVAGLLEVNREKIRIERAHFVRQAEAIDLDALLQFGGGNLAAKGAIKTAQTPVAAMADVDWSGIVVPETLAGQKLFTDGKINFAGSAQSYRLTGAMQAGPAKRIAHFELKVQGTPQRVQVEQFDIVQKPGRLALDGIVDLRPQLAWTLRAQARRFDPGAFAAEWPGSLNFDLNTQGTMSESGPQGTLAVSNLRGRLRSRDLGGHVNLAMTPGMVIAGNADITSGQSRVQLDGRRGKTMDAVATIRIPTLNDLAPNTEGELQGRIAAKGRWPDIDVAGQVSGRGLRIGTLLQAETLALQWQVKRPSQPSGTAALDSTKIKASGFEFETVRSRVEGDMKHHRVDFDASGAPLAAAFRVEGSLQGSTWSGTLQQLTLDVRDAARLTLQEPVKVAYSPDLVKFSQACLADRDIRLCLQGDRASNGAMHATYRMQNVPLALANTFAGPSLPLQFAGTIEGNGNVESTADRIFSGRADIRSASGKISRRFEGSALEPEVLLSYADLNLSAELAGADAHARLGVRLNDTGALNAQVALRGLSEPATGVNGELSANLPNLRVVEVLAPQLANVQGRMDLHANVRGTLDQPQIAGELRVADLGMDVPQAGLKLRGGNVNMTPLASDRFRIAGGIGSGPGRIDFEGEATTAGAIDMRVSGKQFQAADIPSANVVLDPNLQFQRVPDRMTLTGSVTIPDASIDLQKLPRTQSTQGASADVVVVDAGPQQEKEEAQSTPLSADIKVMLGEKVKLVGYGLDARVAGQLDVREQPGSPTTGSGEVRVEGTYKAYGQDLTIQRGQLLFAGTPLDNPRLNMRAVREIKQDSANNITAGFNITGTAKTPQLTVFSEPAMGQSDALAYIVTGKPLSEVGQGGGDDSDKLQSAARSLGAAAGGVLAKNVGKRLGVDEVAVKDEEAIGGGAALTVGQYLSPRLYLSYGVGLFDPGEVIRLRYKLSRSTALEVLNGSEDSRAGIEYRKER